MLLLLLLSRFPTLCDPMDCSLPGSSYGIFQARVLEWVAIAFYREEYNNSLNSSLSVNPYQLKPNHISGLFLWSILKQVTGSISSKYALFESLTDKDFFSFLFFFLNQRKQNGKSSQPFLFIDLTAETKSFLFSITSTSGRSFLAKIGPKRV